MKDLKIHTYVLSEEDVLYRVGERNTITLRDKKDIRYATQCDNVARNRECALNPRTLTIPPSIFTFENHTIIFLIVHVQSMRIQIEGNLKGTGELN